MTTDFIVNNYKLTELPAPIEKVIEFDIFDFHFRMMITDNILIPCVEKNGTTIYEMNCYKDLCKIICSVIDHKRNTHLRLESEPFKKDEVLKNWENQRIRFVVAALDNEKNFHETGSFNSKMPSPLLVK